MPLIYLAEPIDQAKRKDCTSEDDTARDLTLWAEQIVGRVGAEAYRPSAAFTQFNNGTPDSAVSSINSHALERCSALVAVLPHMVATLGVPVEIETALQLGKPTYLITDARMANKALQVQTWRSQGATVWTDDLLDSAWDAGNLGNLTRSMRAKIRQYERDRQAITPIAGAPALSNEVYQFVLQPDSGAVLPGRGYPDDAGLDLTVIESKSVAPGDAVSFRTGVSGALPSADGPMWGMIVGRSSAWARHRLMVIPSVIDSGWRGELFVGAVNLSDMFVTVDVGTRLAQIVPLPAWTGPVVQVDELPEHARGLNGFGSTDSQREQDEIVHSMCTVDSNDGCLPDQA